MTAGLQDGLSCFVLLPWSLCPSTDTFLPNLPEPESSHEISALGDLTAGSGMASGKILSYKMKESMFKDGFWQLYRNEGQHMGTIVPVLQ